MSISSQVLGLACGVLCLAASACQGSSSSPPPAEGGSAPVPPADTGSSGGGEASSGGATATQPPAQWGPEHCPGVGALTRGFEVGNAIGDLGLKDCDSGATASIDDVCGAAATWIFIAHTHCPTCRATAAFTDSVAAEVADKNVAIVHVVHDDDGTSCAEWRAAYDLAGLANVHVYADPDGSAWAKLKADDYTAPSAFLDARRVITFKEHGLSQRAVLSQIDAALAAKP